MLSDSEPRALPRAVCTDENKGWASCVGVAVLTLEVRTRRPRARGLHRLCVRHGAGTGMQAPGSGCHRSPAPDGQAPHPDSTAAVPKPWPVCLKPSEPVCRMMHRAHAHSGGLVNPHPAPGPPSEVPGHPGELCALTQLCRCPSQAPGRLHGSPPRSAGTSTVK